MKRVLLIALASSLLASCGIQGTAESTLNEVKRTNDSTDKMVQTTGQMKDLTQQLADLTNKLLTTTGQLVDLTKQLNGGMAKTNDGIRLQTMTLSLQTMLSDVNTESLTPPALMLPAADKFSEVATSYEITQVYYTYVADAKLGLHDDKGLRSRSRLKSYRAASAIVGMAPDAKIEEILHDQVDVGGRYEGTAYELAASRYAFIRNYLFQPLYDTDKTPVVNEAVVRMAVGYFNSLKALAQSPYVAKFKVTLPQLVLDPNSDDQHPVYIDYTDKVDAAELKQLGQDAIDSFKTGFSPQALQSQTLQALLAQFKI